jgi:GNAT superfamily N-acetyltransferase
MDLQYRLATIEDLPSLVQMLAQDSLGATREKPDAVLSEKYIQAFEKIKADGNQALMVAELDGILVATFQLSFLQYLTHHGGLRLQVEAVRTHTAYRGQGIGKLVFQYIINHAQEKGCIMVQLTTDKQRPDAIRFYETIGFTATHEGMKFLL